MQTQCPHCNTRFRITETQANLAEGFVRCSVCQEVFNVFEVANQHEHQTSLLDGTATNKTTDDPADNLDQSLPHPPTATDESNEHLQHAIPELSADSHDAAQQNADIQETTAANHSADTFDFFDEDKNQSLSHVVPEKYRDTDETPSALSTLLWASAILILTATLTVQYAWFNRSQLNQIPQIQAWLEKTCQQFECKELTLRDPAKIELVSRNVYSHPNEKNALMINVTMKNNADFAQPYPVLQISFSDRRGGIMAARRFRPAEYLAAQQNNTGQQTTENKPHTLFEPGSNMTFTMAIQDPGKQAMTYEFDFL